VESKLLAIATVLALVAQTASAETTPGTVLLASSKGNHTLAIVDPASDRVIAKMPIGPDPHEVAVSDDGRTGFVSNMGTSSLHRIDVLDLVRQRALDPIDTGPLTGVHGLAFAGGKLWFTAQGAMVIARWDPASRQVDWIMGTGQSWTHMIVVMPDLMRIYATNVMSGAVSVFDLQPTKHTLVPTEAGTEGFDVSPDGKELWTASSRSGQIYIIDTAEKKVSQILDAKALGANRVKFTPDGNKVFISSLRSGDLLVYDAKARSEIKRVPVGSGCAGVLVPPEGKRAYVACASDNYVAVVDIGKLASVDRIDVGPQPDGLAWAVRR
jgi:YVTN family beta-propeller protein